MIMLNNKGEIVAEQKVAITADNDVVVTNTLFADRGRICAQNISIRRSDGTVKTIDMFGRLLP